jgi:hypothetical protein
MVKRLDSSTSHQSASGDMENRILTFEWSSLGPTRADSGIIDLPAGQIAAAPANGRTDIPSPAQDFASLSCILRSACRRISA